MGKQQINNNLNRRMMTETGWVYFCRICGTYLPEKNFYKSKSGPFGFDRKCKIHYTTRETDDDGEMDYLKLNPLRDEDFIDVQRLLETLGYSFQEDAPPVHIQFNKRHNIK